MVSRTTEQDNFLQMKKTFQGFRLLIFSLTEIFYRKSYYSDITLSRKANNLIDIEVINRDNLRGFDIFTPSFMSYGM